MSETPEQMTALIARVNSAGREATSHTGRAMRDAVYCTAAPRLAVEIERLAAQVAEQQREIAAALKVLNPNTPESGLEDAARQVKQVAITEAENSTLLEAKLRAVEALRDELLSFESHHGSVTEGLIAAKLTAILTPQEGA